MIMQQHSNIRDIGSYLYCNEDGYLIDDKEKIYLQDKWMVPVMMIVDIIKLNIGDNLVSIYLRGSVARGLAIEGISDIDLYVITSSDPSLKIKKIIDAISNEILTQFLFVTRADIAFYSRSRILTYKERILIKYRSYLLFGEDLSTNIPLLKPGDDTSLTLSRLESDLDKIHRELILGIYKECDTSLTCRWLAKRIVRSGLEIVATKESVYTRDLYKCWEYFSKYFPDHKQSMYRMLNLAINPSSSELDLNVLSDYGRTVLCLWKK